jgi:hypothetical protein
MKHKKEVQYETIFIEVSAWAFVLSMAYMLVMLVM